MIQVFDKLKTNNKTHIKELKIKCICVVYMANYYMALSHKDWELPNPRIWLAETDIDRGLDFPI